MASPIYYQAPGKYFAAHPPAEPVEWEHVPGLGYRYKGEEWPTENGTQPSAATVDSWDPQPEAPSEPLTDVDIATGNFKRAREAAPEALDRLKGAVWAGLVAGGMAPDEATAAGVGLVLLHGPLLAAFEAAGGHPVAAQALYAAIASKPSTDALPWLTAPILAIFSAALTPGK